MARRSPTAAEQRPGARQQHASPVGTQGHRQRAQTPPPPHTDPTQGDGSHGSGCAVWRACIWLFWSHRNSHSTCGCTTAAIGVVHRFYQAVPGRPVCALAANFFQSGFAAPASHGSPGQSDRHRPGCAAGLSLACLAAMPVESPCMPACLLTHGFDRLGVAGTACAVSSAALPLVVPLRLL